MLFPAVPSILSAPRTHPGASHEQVQMGRVSNVTPVAARSDTQRDLRLCHAQGGVPGQAGRVRGGAVPQR